MAATRKGTIIIIMIVLAVLAVLAVAWGGWMALSGKWPSLVRPLQKYYQLEQAFAYPKALPRVLLATQDGGFLLLADRITDSADNLLLERVR